MANEKLNELKALVKIFYDHQAMRIQNGNRIAALYREEFNHAPGEKMTDEEKEDAQIFFEEALNEYHNEVYPDCINPATRKFKSKKKIDVYLLDKKYIKSYSMMCLMNGYVNEYDTEQMYQKAISDIVNCFPIYTQFLKSVKGCGPLMSAAIIASFDIHSARHVSSFWKYAGLDVVNGEARSKKADHLVDVEYTDKNGEVKTKKSITFNPFIKTKLLGVLSGCLIKCGNKEYRAIYDNYKARILERYTLNDVDITPAHLNNMAKRYMIKMFVKDLWNTWRKLEGYPEEPDWYEAYVLGRKHGENYVPNK